MQISRVRSEVNKIMSHGGDFALEDERRALLQRVRTPSSPTAAPAQ